MNIESYFSSLAGLAALCLIVTGYLNTHLLQTSNSTIKQIVSWVVAIILALIGHSKMIGMFEGLDITWTIISGLGVGLISNGYFDVVFVQSILEFMRAKKKVA